MGGRPASSSLPIQEAGEAANLSGAITRTSASSASSASSALAWIRQCLKDHGDEVKGEGESEDAAAIDAATQRITNATMEFGKII